jgi:iron complex outermembrane receptor protein
MRFTTKIALAGVSLLAMPNVAFAQEAPVDESAASNEEIVVTGTLIRGTKVTGSQTISVDASAISSKAAGSTNELLSLIPQISNTFNGRFEGDPRGVGAGISINKPNLRGLPGQNNSSGGTTLVLMDGLRMTPVGVNQSSIDTDVIPAAVIVGIDAVTDGGSSLYGADAVAGVLNFRTMRKFEGLKLDGNFGFGSTIKGYHQWDGSVTAGKSWSTGNAFISAGYSSRDLVLNGDTTWANGLIYNAAGVARGVNTECISPVGSQIKYFKFGGAETNWTNNPAAPGAGVFPVGTACDQTPSNTYLPKQTRANVFVGLSQEFSDTVSLHVTGYWTKRRTELLGYPRGYTTPAQVPAFAGTGPVGGLQFPAGAAPGTIFTVLGGTGFSFGANSAYVNTPSRLGIETWGITPELTVKLPGDWQVRASMHFGRSSNFQHFPGVNAVLTQSYVDSGALNPLNAGAASAAVIKDVTDWENAQDTKQQMFMARVVADGSLFELPGGSAKLAVGAEYQDNKASSRLNSARVGVLGSLPYMNYSRNSKSLFGEVSLPLVDFMTLSASVRYDSYSDFGSTTNPNLGIELNPFSWLKLFGHWNTTFNAPTAVDGLGIGTGRFVCGIYSPAAGPNDPLGKWNKSGDCAFLAEGAKAGIGPQTGNTWAAGFEVTPLSNLRIGAEYYAIDFNNVLGSVDPTNAQTYLSNQDLYVYNPSASVFAGFLGQLTNGATLATQVSSSRIALLIDRRTTNFSKARFEGIDFHANLALDTSLGHFDIGVSGNRGTKATQTTTGVTNDLLALGGPRLTISNTLAWKKGGASARLTVNYSGRYRDGTTDYLNQAFYVDPFIVTNLSVGYDLGDSEGALKGLSLRANVDNLFGVKPTYIRRGVANVQSYANWSLGRVFKVGFSYKY